MADFKWQCGRFRFDLSHRPLVMGIVNCTPDSFSDGGLHQGADAAIAHGLKLWAQGADILDVGGESTRPGATPVDQATELARVLPVIQALAAAGAVVSIDTQKPAVMRAALVAGAVIVNDVAALQAEGALAVVQTHDCGIVLMHRMESNLAVNGGLNTLSSVIDFLDCRVALLVAQGVSRARLVIDPGIGFGKGLLDNLELIRGITQLQTIAPVLLGASRKKLLEAMTTRTVDQRLAGSLALAMMGVSFGAAVLRVHDVAQTIDALKVQRALSLGHLDWRDVSVKQG